MCGVWNGWVRVRSQRRCSLGRQHPSRGLVTVNRDSRLTRCSPIIPILRQAQSEQEVSGVFVSKFHSEQINIASLRCAMVLVHGPCGPAGRALARGSREQVQHLCRAGNQAQLGAALGGLGGRAVKLRGGGRGLRACGGRWQDCSSSMTRSGSRCL